MIAFHVYITSHHQATAVIKEFTLPALGKHISSPKEELANAAASVLLTAMKAMIGKDTANVKNPQEAVVLGKIGKIWC